MSFEKAKADLEEKGLGDHVIVLNESSATVAEAAHALGVEPASIAKTLLDVQMEPNRRVNSFYVCNTESIWPTLLCESQKCNKKRAKPPAFRRSCPFVLYFTINQAAFRDLTAPH